MLARLPKIVLVLALACSIGLHWTFLQAVAWTGMIATYSRNATLGEALVKTFDGQHPCKLCQEIAKGAGSERKPECSPESNKFEFSYAPTVFVFRAPTHFWEVRAADDTADWLTQAPPVPPPRILPG